MRYMSSKTLHNGSIREGPAPHSLPGLRGRGWDLSDTRCGPAQWWVELESASPRPKQLDHSGRVCGLPTAVYTDQAQMDI